MRRTVGSCIAVAVLALAAGCGKTSGTPTTNIGGGSGIEGEYVVVGMEFDGEPMTDAEIAKQPEAERAMRITRDQMIKTKDGKDDPKGYTLDTSKTPHEIDVTSKQNGKEEKMYGIYKVDGDKLVLCVAMSDKAADRPKEFKTTGDAKTLTMLLTLKKK